MALVVNSIGEHIEHEIMKWTANDESELPVEDGDLIIPNGSQCRVIKDKTLTMYIYDNVAKEWFSI